MARILVLCLSVGLLAGCGGPNSREAVRKSEFNLKRLGLGLHNYAAANSDKLPDPAWGVKPGETVIKPIPNLSWRVAMLPYIEEAALFKQFKPEEPWDSEHNKALIPKMPAIYFNGFGTPQDGKTCYKVFVGGGALFERTGTKYKLGNIPDLSMNTFFVVEGGESVIWTKPDDFEFDPARPLPTIALPGRDFFLAVTVDGSLRRISATAPEAEIKKAIGADDGAAKGLFEP